MLNWTVHLEGGPRRVNHAAVLLGDKVYSFGGYCSGEDFEIRRPIDVHVLDTITLRWKLLATTVGAESSSVPYHRYGHTVVSYGGRAYLFGGRNDGDGACNVLYEFDPATGKWTMLTPDSGYIPPSRDGHTAVVVGDNMIIFGGFEEEFHRFSNDVFAYNFTTRRWSQLLTKASEPDATPSWRDFHTAAAIGRRMYVFGGRSDQMGQYHSNREVYDANLYYLDLDTLAWHVVRQARGQIPIGRRSHSSFLYKGMMYVFGGYNGQSDEHFSSVHQFNPKTLLWTELCPYGQGPKPRRRQACVLVEDRIFLFGGTSPKENREECMDEWADMDSDEPDLTDHADLYILDFAPKLKTLCIMALRQDLGRLMNANPPLLPYDLQWEVLAMTRNNKILTSPNTRSETSSG